MKRGRAFVRSRRCAVELASPLADAGDRLIRATDGDGVQSCRPASEKALDRARPQRGATHGCGRSDLVRSQGAHDVGDRAKRGLVGAKRGAWRRRSRCTRCDVRVAACTLRRTRCEIYALRRVRMRRWVRCLRRVGRAISPIRSRNANRFIDPLCNPTFCFIGRIRRFPTSTPNTHHPITTTMTASRPIRRNLTVIR